MVDSAPATFVERFRGQTSTQDIPDVSSALVDKTATAITKVLGIKGEERYQLWPERAIRDTIEAVKLPKQVASGEVELGSKEFQEKIISLAPLAILGIAPFKVAMTGMTKSESLALNQYIGSGYEAINKHLRGEAVKRRNFEGPIEFAIDKTLAKPAIKLLDDLFKTVPESETGMKLFRGIMGGRDLKYTPGETLTFPAFTSTSKSQHKARSFGNVMFEIYTPAGSKVLDITKQTGKGFEREVLFPRNSKFKVLDKEDTGQQIIIILQHVPNKGK